MPFEAKKFDHLLGISGLSDQLLNNHFTLYQGYVANFNKMKETLSTLFDEGRTSIPEYMEIKRRIGWEFNGVLLHEYYFENLQKEGLKSSDGSSLHEKISQDFGNFENWEKAFRAVGAMRGIGWTIAYYEPRSNTIFNAWINEHDTGHLAGATPLLIMDVFEHAYMLDYGIKKAGYIDAFFRAINWETVIKRFDMAQKKIH